MSSVQRESQLRGGPARLGPQIIGMFHPVASEPKFSFSYLSHKFARCVGGTSCLSTSNRIARREPGRKVRFIGTLRSLTNGCDADVTRRKGAPCSYRAHERINSFSALSICKQVY